MANQNFYSMFVGLLLFALAFQPVNSYGDDDDRSLYQFVSVLVANHPDVKASYESLRAAEASAIAAGRPL